MQNKSILLTAANGDELARYLKDLPQGRFFVLCDSNTWHECFPLIAPAIADRPCHIHIIPPGEFHKQTDTLLGILEELAAQGFQKSDLLINLGGGTVSDIGGLAAALYQRGMPYINLPTTLLAMADAAHGGKTAVDFMGIKNLIGTLWFPEQTIVFAGFLKTLPRRELYAGYVEVLKQALLEGKKAWDKAAGLRPEQLTEYPEIIYNAARFKMKIVRQDPGDQGIRQTLNMGHTIGHAVESWALNQPQGPLLHGEAVAFGMLTELRLSVYYAGLDETFAHSAIRVFRRFTGSPLPSHADIDNLIHFMRHDKKNRSVAIRFSLLAKPGKALTGIGIPEDKIHLALEETLMGIKNQ
jgi:3-dehydroquinate synthase